MYIQVIISVHSVAVQWELHVHNSLEKPYNSLDIIKVKQILPAFIQLNKPCCVRAALRQTDKFMYDDFIAPHLSRSIIFTTVLREPIEQSQGTEQQS